MSIPNNWFITKKLALSAASCTFLSLAVQIAFAIEANSTAPYVSTLQREIKRAWQVAPGYPAQLTALVRFTIHRQGEISNLKIHKRSGSAQFDQAALLAIATAAPFNPLPDGAPEKVDIEFTFDQRLMDKNVSSKKTATTKTTSNFPNMKVESCGQGPLLNPEKITHFVGPRTIKLFNRHDYLLSLPVQKPVAELRIVDKDGTAELLLPDKSTLANLSKESLKERWGSRCPKFEFADFDSSDFLLDSKQGDLDGSRFLVEVVFEANNKPLKYRVTNTYKVDSSTKTAGIERTNWITVAESKQPPSVAPDPSVQDR